nr:hypothetical protein [Tanacetum cinerariifolium]
MFLYHLARKLSHKNIQGQRKESHQAPIDTSLSHHKSSAKSVDSEEPSHTVDDSRVQKNQEFDTDNNNEQPDDKTAPKNDWQDLRKRTIYTAYLDPQGVIYVDQNNRNKLMCTYKLHKFNDGTLDSVRTAIHDITLGIRMEYLLKKKWGRLDKQRAHVMIHNIDKLLFERRLMRNLEKFISGREYGNDLRMLEQTI